MVSSPHYKVVIKALVKAAMQNYSVQDIRDLEACLAGLRSDKIKEENAAKLAKKGQWPLIPCPACVYGMRPSSHLMVKSFMSWLETYHGALILHKVAAVRMICLHCPSAPLR